MASAVRTEAACLSASLSKLMDANFHEGPIYRMGFDAHVRAWSKHVGLMAFRAYHHNPAFRAAYEARVAA